MGNVPPYPPPPKSAPTIGRVQLLIKEVTKKKAAKASKLFQPADKSGGKGDKKGTMPITSRKVPAIADDPATQPRTLVNTNNKPWAVATSKVAHRAA